MQSSLSERGQWIIAAVLPFAGLAAAPMPAQDAAADKPFLHPLFTDHVVLQRDTAIRVWGWTQPGRQVTVALAGRTATGTGDAQGKWLVRLPAMPAGGPHVMTVAGPQTIEVRDVLLGDVWLCSGQSNMQMSVSGCMNAKAEIAAAVHSRIRFFSVPWAGLRPGGPQVMHTEPQETVAARWQVCSPATVGEFSAVGYFFARELRQAVDVPVGLIRAAVGGSAITSWCAPSLLHGVPELKPGLESLDALRALIREHKTGEAYFKGVVERWWQENDPGTREAWFKPECDPAGWRRVSLAAESGKAGVPRFHGVVWFRKEVNVPPDWAGKELSLYLTGIWEPDTTWFNGSMVGAFDQGWINRTSRVPAALVKAGRNVVAVRVIAQPGRGYQGPAAASKLELPGGKSAAIPLGGERLLRESTPAANLPPFPHRLDNDFQLPTVLYNGMIAPLAPYALKGVLWYQGETPCPGGHAVHRRLLAAMIADWRSRFASPESWFLIVQLPVLGGTPTLNPEDTGAAEIRAVQWEVGRAVANADTAVITDLGDPHDIHPKNKQDVGKRLALIAQARIFGKAVEYSGPVFKSATVEGRTVRVRYDHLGGGLVQRGERLDGFALAGTNRRYAWADAKIDGDEVLVSSPQVAEPKFLRYDYVDVPRSRLWNKAGLPAAPFAAAIGLRSPAAELRPASVLATLAATAGLGFGSGNRVPARQLGVAPASSETAKLPDAAELLGHVQHMRHPRLLFADIHATPGYRNRARPPWSEYERQIVAGGQQYLSIDFSQKTPLDRDSYRARDAKDLALAYQITGDRKFAVKATDALVHMRTCGEGTGTPKTGGAIAVMAYCLAYDWIHPTLDAATDDLIAGKLARYAADAYANLNDGGKDLAYVTFADYHGQAYPCLGVAACALAGYSGEPKRGLSSAPADWLRAATEYSFVDDRLHAHGRSLVSFVNDPQGFYLSGAYRQYSLNKYLLWFSVYHHVFGRSILDDYPAAKRFLLPDL
jgi:sialate O-acetylesterase